MKKGLLAFTIIAGILVIGFMSMSAFANASGTRFSYDDAYPMYHSRGFMGGMHGHDRAYWENEYLEESDYDHYYRHLNDEDKDTIDMLYAEKIASYDIDAMNESERLEMIETVKEELATFMVENDMIPEWLEPDTE